MKAYIQNGFDREHSDKRLMKSLLVQIVLALLVVSNGSLSASDQFPVLGLWRVVSGEKDGEPASLQNGEMELEFLPDGVLFVTLTLPENGVIQPIRMKWSYSFLKPDIVTYTLNGSIVERQRFKIRGDFLDLEHLDYKTKSTAKRIAHTEFKDPPVDTQELPQ